MGVLDILKFFGISLIPFGVAVLIHLIFKFTNPLMVRKPEYLVPIKRKFLYKWVKYPLQKFGYIIFTTKKGSYWWKMSVLGVVFGGFAILGYFVGVPVKVPTEKLVDIVGSDTFIVGNSTVYPAVAGLVFGWPAGVIAGVIAFIFRISYGGWLALPTSIALLAAGGITSLVSHYLFKDKRPKWYFGILVAAFIECLNIILIFLFNIRHISDVNRLISLFGTVCVCFSAFSCGLATIIISLIEKERIVIKKKELNNISFRVEVALVLICFISMTAVTASVWGISLLKSRSDYNNIISQTSEDVFVRLKKELQADSEENVTGNSAVHSLIDLPNEHHVGTEGYVITLAGSENLPEPTQSLNDEENTVYYDKDEIINIRNNSWYYHHYWGKFYFYLKGDSQKHYLSELTDDSKFEGNKIFSVLIDDDLKMPCLMAINKIDFDLDDPGEGKEKKAIAYTATIVPYSEIDSSSDTIFRVSLYTNLLVVIALFIAAEYFVYQKIIKRVEMMDEALEQIMDGNLDKEVHVEGYNEFTNLSNNINLTVGALKNYASEVELRIDNELKFARDIQTSSVPTVFPFEKSFNIYARMEPAKEVGGDFYDYIRMKNGRILFLIADVSGKGIPAAMFMMRARTLIKSLSATEMPLDEIVNTANKELCSQNDAALFVTAWIGILDTNNGELRYINAGHMNPLVKKKDGKFAEMPNKHNFVLAAMPDFVYKSDVAYLSPGDEMILYTDGVSEAHNPQKELYGVERLINFANNAQYFNAKQLLDEISDDVVKFADGMDQFDDTTLLILRYIGTQDYIPETAITLKARPTNAVLAVNFVESVLAKYELPPTFIARVSIVIDELFANIAFYAYPQDYVGEATIQVDFRNEAFYLTLIDSGIPFDPTAPREVDTSSSIDDRKRGGLGIFIVKKTMDEMKYEYKNNKNTLNLVKYLKNIPQTPKKKDDNNGGDDNNSNNSTPTEESKPVETINSTPVENNAAPVEENKPATEAPKEEKKLITDPDALEAALAALPDDD